MKRIAPDVERLMWLVAEGRDPRAIADFESRFPDLRLELAKHIAMVNGLKDAGRKMPAHDIPRFVPRYAESKPRNNRPLYVAFAFILAAVAFGTYAVTLYVTAPSPVRPTPPPAVQTSDPNIPVAAVPHSDQKTGPNPGVDVAPYQAPRITDLDNPLLKKVKLKVAHVPLTDALVMVCRLSNVTADIGPGLSKENVDLDYDGQSTIDILSDLGQKYGFTPMPDERGKVLIIPVRPDGAGTAAKTEATDRSSVSSVVHSSTDPQHK